MSLIIKKNFSKTEKRKILDDRILKKEAARKIDVDENEKQEESPERIPKKKKELAEGEVKVPKPRKRVPAHAEEGAAVEEGAEKKKTARVKSKAKIEEEEKVTDPEVKRGSRSRLREKSMRLSHPEHRRIRLIQRQQLSNLKLIQPRKSERLIN